MLRRGGEWASGVLVFLSLSFVTACGGDDSSEGSGGSSTGGAAGGGAGGSGGMAGSGGGTAGAGGAAGSGGIPSGQPKPSPGCTSGSIVPGDSTVAISHGGKNREYRLHVPPSYDGTKALPLVLNFHGYSSNAPQQQLFSLMNGKSDSAGFVLIYPQGLPNPGGGQQSFNGGLCCAFGDLSRDDVGFTSAMLDDIFAKGCIDERRVYSTGMSNGGAMSHRLACELSDRITAVAPVAHILGIPPDSCKPARPVPIVHFHGTTDQLVPYVGGGASGYPSVPDTFAGWGARHGCTGAPKETLKVGAARCETYESCKEGAEVTLCTLEGMGHCWPGQPFCLPGSLGGTPSTDINANDRMWETFQKYALP